MQTSPTIFANNETVCDGRLTDEKTHYFSLLHCILKLNRFLQSSCLPATRRLTRRGFSDKINLAYCTLQVQYRKQAYQNSYRIFCRMTYFIIPLLHRYPLLANEMLLLDYHFDENLRRETKNKSNPRSKCVAFLFDTRRRYRCTNTVQ